MGLLQDQQKSKINLSELNTCGVHCSINVGELLLKVEVSSIVIFWLNTVLGKKCRYYLNNEFNRRIMIISFPPPKF